MYLDIDEFEKDVQLVRPFYDAVAQKLYYQTLPYLKDGKVVIKRVSEHDVTIEKAFNIIEEYKFSTKKD